MLSAIERGIQDPSILDKTRAETVHTDVLSGKIPGSRDHVKSWKLRVASILSGGLGLLSVACGGPREIPSATNTTIETPRPTATARPGGPDIKYKDPRLNELFDKITKKQADEKEIIEYNKGAEAEQSQAAALATAEAQKPTPTPTPEVVKEIQCGILSPENCAKGEYIKWKSPTGRDVFGVGFVLKSGVSVMTPEDLVVAGSEIKQPHTYSGYYIDALSKDGKRNYLYFGDITPSNITGVGSMKIAGTEIGKIADTSNPVFDGTPYNLVVHYPDDTSLKSTFTEFTPATLKIISNTPVPIKAQAPLGIKNY